MVRTWSRWLIVFCGLDRVTFPGTEIKSVGDSASLRSTLPDGWSMYDPCDLMTVAFSRGVAEVRDPYVARVVDDGATLVGRSWMAMALSCRQPAWRPRVDTASSIACGRGRRIGVEGSVPSS
jgi:hypothetical protein